MRKRWRRTRRYVWCDHHGMIHVAERDVFDEDGPLGNTTECHKENWRPVAVYTEDPEETFE